MGSSAQNSRCKARSGSTGFRSRFRRRSGRLWCKAKSGSAGFRRRFREALAQSQVRFNRVPDQVLEKIWEALVQSPVRFNRVPKKVLEKVPGGFGAKPGQVQQGSGEGAGEGSGRPSCRDRSVSEKVWEAVVRFREALVRSQVRFNRVPEQVPEKVWEALVQSQVRLNKIWGHLTHGNPAEVFPALGFAARFREICKIKRCGCWGYHRSLFSRI